MISKETYIPIILARWMQKLKSIREMKFKAIPYDLRTGPNVFLAN
jgi:hypothetical protein